MISWLVRTVLLGYLKDPKSIWLLDPDLCDPLKNRSYLPGPSRPLENDLLSSRNQSPTLLGYSMASTTLCDWLSLLFCWSSYHCCFIPWPAIHHFCWSNHQQIYSFLQHIPIFRLRTCSPKKFGIIPGEDGRYFNWLKPRSFHWKTLCVCHPSSCFIARICSPVATVII